MSGNKPLQLVLVDHFDIKNKREGLDEPSGLALSLDKSALWTISDDTNKVFKLDLEGRVDQSFDISESGLEGIALDPTGELLLAVKEESNEILRLKIETGNVIERKSLAAMEDYESIAGYFADDPTENKGLEGIAWNDQTGTIFVLKEGIPGLLIEISADFKAIQSHKLLDREKGFTGAELDDDPIDFSGICYDHGRDSFWIVSDKARRLFLYELARDEITQNVPLSDSLDGGNQRIKKAEGVAFDPESSRLYVVRDIKKLPRLYVFEIRE
jgi:uncharacterized protein YjiK